LCGLVHVHAMSGYYGNGGARPAPGIRREDQGRSVTPPPRVAPAAITPNKQTTSSMIAAGSRSAGSMPPTAPQLSGCARATGNANSYLIPDSYEGGIRPVSLSYLSDAANGGMASQSMGPAFGRQTYQNQPAPGGSPDSRGTSPRFANRVTQQLAFAAPTSSPSSRPNGVERPSPFATISSAAATEASPPRPFAAVAAASQAPAPAPAPAPSGMERQQRDVQGRQELEAALAEKARLLQEVDRLRSKELDLQRERDELNEMLDDHGKQFMDALVILQTDIDELKRKNERMAKEKEVLEERLQEGGDSQVLASLHTEQEYQDMLEQMEELEKELRQELEEAQAERDQAQARATREKEAFAEKLSAAERAREDLARMMSDEGEELRARIERLTKDKQLLHFDLQKARSTGPATSSSLSPANDASQARIRLLTSEVESLKNKLVVSEGNAVLAQNQLRMAKHTLQIAEAEKVMLQEELDKSRKT